MQDLHALGFGQFVLSTPAGAPPPAGEGVRPQMERRDNHALLGGSLSLGAPWKVFHRQMCAFTWADSQPPTCPFNLAYFSFENPICGTRQFLVSTFEEFWRRYRQMKGEHRHYYEILREGTPCHLFFDIEFSRCANPTLDGASAITGLLELVQEKLQDSFRVAFTEQDLTHLDSSTELKFSRHLIIRVPRAAFACAVNCGGFVK